MKTHTKQTRTSYGPNGPISEKGKLIEHKLIKDILKNWENIESILYDIPEIHITLKKEPIVIRSRKLDDMRKI